MIEFVTGTPGSGKSYYGLFNIAINFNKTLSENKKFKSFQLSETKYKYALTNINEIKFDSFDNVKSLIWADFFKILKNLFDQKKLEKTDTELLDLVKDEIFSNTLIILDECHNYLNKDNEVIVWWLSYHRHFFQDILLITQDLKLVNQKYKSFSELYYKAIPSSRKLFNSKMVYQQYTGHQLYKKQESIVKKLPILKEVFSLYGSGDNNKQKSLVLHYVGVSFVLFLLVMLVFYFTTKNMKGDSDLKSPATNNNSIASKTVQQINHNFNNSSNVDGVYYEMYCNFSYCFINGNIYQKQFILEILKTSYKANIIAKSKYKYYFITNDKFNLFQKKSKNKDIPDEKSSFLPTITMPK
ncbi:MAG: zonular occludens toxin domain-containing protein [Aliarcobacter sp.]|nr:zonular occludens toxin domain-containing protein [Aliarcobacter sp.]